MIKKVTIILISSVQENCFYTNSNVFVFGIRHYSPSIFGGFYSRTILDMAMFLQYSTRAIKILNDDMSENMKVSNVNNESLDGNNLKILEII